MAIDRRDIEGILERAWQDMGTWMSEAFEASAVMRKLATVVTSPKDTVAIDGRDQQDISKDGATPPTGAKVFRRLVQPVWRVSTEKELSKEVLEKHDLGNREPLQEAVSGVATTFAKIEDSILLNGVDGRDGAIDREIPGRVTGPTLIDRVDKAIALLEAKHHDGPYWLLAPAGMDLPDGDDLEALEKALGGEICRTEHVTKPILAAHPLKGVRLHVVRPAKLVVLSITDAEAVIAQEQTMSFDLDDRVGIVQFSKPS